MDDNPQQDPPQKRPEPEVQIPELPLLAGLYHVIGLSDERVEIANAGRRIALNGKDFAEKVMPLLDLLDGETPFERVKEQFPDLAERVVKALVQRGMVTDAAPGPDTAEKAPQLASFGFLGLATSKEAAQRLRAATVAVIGCGAVGAQIAVNLAKAGVGALWLADETPVSAVDIATSAVYRPESESLSRAKATAALCEDFSNIDCKITELPIERDDVDHLDLGVVEIGYDDKNFGPADSFLQAGAPYLPYSQDALEAVVGPTVYPGGEPCHRCIEYRRQSHLSDLEEYVAYRRQRAKNADGADAFVAAHSAMVAGAVATEALRAVIDPGIPERHIAIILDLARMNLEKEEVFLIPTCEACAGASSFAQGREVRV